MQKDWIFARYCDLHKQWTQEKRLPEHIAALPMLVLAETIERSVGQLLLEMKNNSQAKFS